MISDLSLWAHSIENLLSWTASSLFSIIWWGFLRHFVGSRGSGLNISLTFYLVTRLSGEQGRWAALGGVSRHRHLLSLAAQSLRQRNKTVEDGNNSQTSPSVSMYYYWLVVILQLIVRSQWRRSAGCTPVPTTRASLTTLPTTLRSSPARTGGAAPLPESQILYRVCFAVGPLTCLTKLRLTSRTLQFCSLWIKPTS